jgi:hypothetical protein
MSTKKEIKGVLSTSGRELPPAKRGAELKRSVLEGAVVQAPAAGQSPAGGVAPRARGRAKPFYRSRLAMAGASAACVIIVLVIVGVLAMHSMPGDTLYPVKRFLQKSRVVLAIGGTARANASLVSAESRLEDLRYARTRDLQGYYLPLTNSAVSDINKALSGNPSAETRERAKEDTNELRDLGNNINAEVDRELKKALDGLDKKIDQQVDKELQQELKDISP